VGSALHSLPKYFNSGDSGWTDENMAKLEKEPGLALGEQQVESSSARTPISPSPRSAEAPQDEIQSRERSETTGSRPKELRDACRCSTPAQGFEWEQRKTRVAIESLRRRKLGEEALIEEVGGLEVRQQGELAGSLYKSWVLIPSIASVVTVIGVHGMGFATGLSMQVLVPPFPPLFPLSGSPLRARRSGVEAVE